MKDATCNCCWNEIEFGMHSIQKDMHLATAVGLPV